jgi:hypothetical protein
LAGGCGGARGEETDGAASTHRDNDIEAVPH